MRNLGRDMLLGVAVGDALGVPFEFCSREEMKRNPAKGMVGFGTHGQPIGTWSDDSSLTFCLAESMTIGYDLADISTNFINWKGSAYWSARGSVFDIGMTTTQAISRLDRIISSNSFEELKILKYGGDEMDNGNGSLMRILPLLFEIKGLSLKDQFNLIWENSALTHRHIRAGMACMIYLKFAENIVNCNNKDDAYQKTRNEISILWDEIEFSQEERQCFHKVVQSDIREVSQKNIMSGGYVIESLEASLWCFLTTEDYESAVLTAINFGHDTDTTGAITGGLAGIYYGSDSISEYWLYALAKLEDIIDLGERLGLKYQIVN